MNIRQEEAEYFQDNGYTNVVGIRDATGAVPFVLGLYRAPTFFTRLQQDLLLYSRAVDPKQADAMTFMLNQLFDFPQTPGLYNNFQTEEIGDTSNPIWTSVSLNHDRFGPGAIVPSFHDSIYEAGTFQPLLFTGDGAQGIACWLTVNQWIQPYPDAKGDATIETIPVGDDFDYENWMGEFPFYWYRIALATCDLEKSYQLGKVGDKLNKEVWRAVDARFSLSPYIMYFNADRHPSESSDNAVYYAASTFKNYFPGGWFLNEAGGADSEQYSGWLERSVPHEECLSYGPDGDAVSFYHDSATTWALAMNWIQTFVANYPTDFVRIGQ